MVETNKEPQPSLPMPRLDTSGKSIRIKPQKERKSWILDSSDEKIFDFLDDAGDFLMGCMKATLAIAFIGMGLIMCFYPLWGEFASSSQAAESFSSVTLQELEAERIKQNDILVTPGAVEATALATAEAEKRNINPSDPRIWEAGDTHYIGFVDRNSAEEGYALECIVGDAAECVIPTPDK